MKLGLSLEIQNIGKEVMEGWTNHNNEEIHILYFFIKSDWDDQIKGGRRNSYKIL